MKNILVTCQLCTDKRQCLKCIKQHKYIHCLMFWFVIFTRSGDERTRLWNSLSRDGWYLLFCFRYDTDIFKPSIVGNIISNYTHLILDFKAMFFFTFRRTFFVYTVRNKIYYNCILALYRVSNLKGAKGCKWSILVPHKYVCFKGR